MIWRTLLLVILFILVARAVLRLVRGVIQAAGTGGATDGGQRPAAPAVKMTRDPVCGTYVVPGKALELTRGRETIYFCSDRCRDQWGART